MSLIIALGNPFIFFQKPISLIFIVLLVAYVGWKIWSSMQRRKIALASQDRPSRKQE
jgi:TctA family transporter